MLFAATSTLRVTAILVGQFDSHFEIIASSIRRHIINASCRPIYYVRRNFEKKEINHGYDVDYSAHYRNCVKLPSVTAIHSPVHTSNNAEATFDLVAFDNVVSTLLLVWTGL